MNRYAQAALEARIPLFGVRHLRITKLERGERVECWKYRPTRLAARQAAADAKWLQSRNPAAQYELEAVEYGDGPLVLDADEPSTEEKLAEARVANGEYDVVEKEPDVTG